MQHLKRLTALVMAAVMVLSLVGCGGSGDAVRKPQAAPQLQRPVQRPTVTTPQPTAPEATLPEEEVRLEFLSAPTVQPDRDSLEQVAQLVTGSDSEFEELTDEELTDLIEDQLRQEESVGSPVDPGAPKPPPRATISRAP